VAHSGAHGLSGAVGAGAKGLLRAQGRADQFRPDPNP
jgi:hypothetical protein